MAQVSVQAAGDVVKSVGERARRHIALRTLPLLFIVHVVAHLDRVSVGYAALEMSRDLSFPDKAVGFGAGIFFLGYVLLQIPGGLIALHGRARYLISALLVIWGAVTILTSQVHTVTEFYLARFALGVAESAFIPAAMIYLTQWFRRADRAKAMATFLASISVANMIGSPLAGWILGVHWLGLAGWRWLFVLDGLPAILLGIVVFLHLADCPEHSSWLARDEQAWITHELNREQEEQSGGLVMTLSEVLRSQEVLLMFVAYSLEIASLYGFIIWLPTILKRATGLPNLALGFLGTTPYVVGLVGIIWNAWHSDRTGERRWHSAVPLFTGAIALAMALVFRSNLWLAYVGMVVASAGTIVFLPSFWAMPTEFLPAAGAAGAVGLINCAASLGGFSGPYIIGYLSSRNNSFVPGLTFVLAALTLSATIIATLPRRLVGAARTRV